MINIPTKKLRNGFTMPVFGLGTWGMGGWEEASTKNDTEDIASIKRAIDAGVTHIDTAEIYGDGHAEELVGQALQGYDRSKLLLVSKVYRSHLEYDALLTAAEQSLERLQTDYLDVYMIHCHNKDIPIKKSIDALNKLVDDGVVKHIAVSNFSVEQMEEAMHLSKHPIVASQLQYNLAIRKRGDQGLLQHAQENDWMFIAWRPIRDVLQIKKPQIMKIICAKYEKTPAQIAINWLISQENVVTLAKCGTKEHLDDSLGALGWNLESEDIEALAIQFPHTDSLTQ